MSQLEREIIGFNEPTEMQATHGDGGVDHPNVLDEDRNYINELIADLKGMNEEDLQNMYNQISLTI